MRTAIALACLLTGLSLYVHAWIKDGDRLVQTEMWSGGVIAIAAVAWMLAQFFGLA
jgi:hypothetical protein